MTRSRGALVASLLPGAALAGAALLAAAVLSATLEPDERELLWKLVEARFALLVFVWLALAVAIGAAARRAWLRWVAGPAQLAEQARTLLPPSADHALPPQDSAATRTLAEVLGALVAQRTALRADVDARIAAASRDIDLERKRLATLMAELHQSVVVCNLDGRVLLYNSARNCARCPSPPRWPAAPNCSASGARSMRCSTARWWRTRSNRCRSGCGAGSRIRRRSS